jgi:RNA polymerase sigma factor (sigma-70 family)
MPDVSLQKSEFEQLMADLASGSEDAAWRITELYTPHILRVVRASLPAIIRPKLDSQDFAQAVWASMLLKSEYLSHLETPEQLIALLAATARHKVIDAYRHYTLTQAYNVRTEQALEPAQPLSSGFRTTDRESGIASRDPTPSQTAMLREQWRLTIENCSPRDKEILAMRMRGETYDAISEKLGMSVATVRRVLDRVISDLRK